MTIKSAAAAAGSRMPDRGVDDELAALIEFRAAVAGSFRRWSDTLIETVDALACSGRPVISPAWLSLEPELRRGYGSVYQALETADAIDPVRMRDALAAAAVGRGGSAWFAVDVTPWPRPEADKSTDRGMCYVTGDAQVATPGWSMLWAAHVGTERSAQVLPVDVDPLAPATNTNEAAAAQVRRITERVTEHLDRGPGRSPAVPLFLLDAGFCPIYLTQQVSDIAQVLVRLRTDRVFYARPGPKPAGRRGPQATHGRRFKLSEPDTWHEPDQAVQVRLHAGTDDEVTITARFWHRLHPAPRTRRKWDGIDPVEGTVCHRTATWTRTGHTQHWWLWWAGPHGSFDADVVARAYLHRFSIEHGFKFAKQLGWTKYKPISPATATNWTWLVIVAMCHFTLARHLAEDYRLPWDSPGPATPARVHRVFRRIHTRLPQLASAPRNTRPGPGRPPGARNRHQRPPRPVTKKGRQPNTGHPKGRRLPLTPEPNRPGP